MPQAPPISVNDCGLFQSILSRNVPEGQRKSTDLPSDGRKGDLLCVRQNLISIPTDAHT